MAGVVAEAKAALAQIVKDFILAIPGIVAAIIIIGLGYVVGKAVAEGIRRVMRGTGLEAMLDETSLGRKLRGAGSSTTNLIAGVAYAYILIISVVIGLQKLQLGGIAASILASIADYLPKLAAGVIIITLGLVFVEALAEYIRRLLVTGVEATDKVLGVIADVVKIALAVAIIVAGLQVMSIPQLAMIYSIVIGFLVIGIGVLIGDALVDQIAEKHEQFRPVAGQAKFLVYSIFLLVGVAGVFSSYPAVASIVKTLAWAFAIAAGLLLAPAIYRLAKQGTI
ncbi:MAG: hypothetical protein LRS49_03260 [Desulfurococcales archaeon]|nr:hypothetical protein [Desulfurococcales archaeon]